MANAVRETREEKAAHAGKVKEAASPTGEQMRLPETEAEWNEVQSAAFDGPGEIYAWTHGKNSVMAQKTKSLTWDDLGETDPFVGCPKIIKALRKTQEKAAPPAKVPPKASFLDELDPETRAMVEEDKKLGKIL